MSEPEKTKGFKSLFSKSKEAKQEEQVTSVEVSTHPTEEVSENSQPSPVSATLVDSFESTQPEASAINKPTPYSPHKEPAPKVKGWNNDFSTAPTNGDRVMLSLTGTDQGVLAYWRVSKYVDRAKLRYVAKGRWTDFTTRLDVPFEPLYWKAYSAEEYWPLQGGKK